MWHGLGDRPRRCCDHRQAVDHRFRINHAVAFVEGRQDKGIGLLIGLRDLLRRPFASECDAPVKTGGRNFAADRSRGWRIPRERPDAGEPPVEIADPGQRLDEQHVPFARQQIRNTEQ